MYIFDHISICSPWNEKYNISDNIVEEIRTQILCPVTSPPHPPQIVPFTRCVGKYFGPDSPQMAILYDACALYAG